MSVICKFRLLYEYTPHKLNYVNLRHYFFLSSTDYATCFCMIYWLYYISRKHHNVYLIGLAVAHINIEGNRA